MNKLKTFWMVFKRSLIDPSYYKAVIAAPTSFSIKYLAFLIFITSLALSLFFVLSIARQLPKIPAFTQSIKTAAYSLYPPQLILMMKNFELSTNVREPFAIPFPAEMRDKIASKDDRITANLVVIDTKGAVEDFSKYNTLILVTKKSVVGQDSKNSKNVYFFSDYPQLKDGGTFDKKSYDLIMQNLEPYLAYIQPIAYIGIVLLIFIIPFMLTVVTLIGKLILMLIWGFATWILSKILSIELTYAQAYRVSIHAFTPIFILDIAKDFAKIKVPGLLMFVLFILFVGYILKSAHLKGTSKKKSR